MGYCSDVALVMSPSVVDEFGIYMDELSEQNFHARCKLADFLSSASDFRTKTNGCVLYVWYVVKWNPRRPDCTGPYHIQKFLDRMREYSIEDYLFIRLGENFGDLETSGEMWDNPFSVHITREISYDGKA